MGTQHVSKGSQSCLFDWCCALQTIRDRWHPHKPTCGEWWPSRLIRTSQRGSAVWGCCRGGRWVQGFGERHHVKEKRGATDVPPGQRHSVPAASRAQTWFVCIQWNCFCIQRGFQLLWGRWKALLAALKCLVLPAFGSMHGARTKYTTVQCKSSGKKLIQHRATWTTGKQGGVDGLPWRFAHSFFFKKERCSHCWSWTRTTQRKVRGQQVSEGSNNHKKFHLVGFEFKLGV